MPAVVVVVPALMLQLIVFRHAKAAREPGIADHDRPLAERGRRNAREMGAWLAAEGFAPDLALISDSKRTRQTFNLARTAFPARMRIFSDPQLYHASEAKLLAAVREIPSGASRVLLCGHNPGLHDFVTGLVGSADRPALDLFRTGFPTAALAVLGLDIAEWRDTRWRDARLLRFATPASVSGNGGDGD